MNRQEKENLLCMLYGKKEKDNIIMGELRRKAFTEFLEKYKQKFLVNVHPDGYVTKCPFCYGDLIVNKFTGTTFCYSCRQELPFELLLRKEGDNE